MKRSEAFPSQYLSKDDVQPPIRAAIKTVVPETIEGESGARLKPVIYFHGNTKPWILNATNWMVLEGAWGDDSDAWTGKTIELYLDPSVMFGKDRVGGVRVRVPTGQQPIAQPASAGPVLLAFGQALKACADVGVTKEQVVAHLRGQGFTGYRADRDTPTIRQIIARAMETQAPPLGESQIEEDIPF